MNQTKPYVGKNLIDQKWYVGVPAPYGGFHIWSGHPTWESAYAVACNVAQLGVM